MAIPYPLSDPTIPDRVAGMKWAEEVVSALREESDAYCEGFWRELQQNFPESGVRQTIPKSKKSKAPQRREPADAAIEQADRIIEQSADLPKAGYEFGNSVSEKCSGIIRTIERTDEVTERQQAALDNMEAGMAKWFQTSYE